MRPAWILLLIIGAAFANTNEVEHYSTNSATVTKTWHLYNTENLTINRLIRTQEGRVVFTAEGTTLTVKGFYKTCTFNAINDFKQFVPVGVCPSSKTTFPPGARIAVGAYIDDFATGTLLLMRDCEVKEFFESNWDLFTAACPTGHAKLDFISSEKDKPEFYAPQP